jgi:hypothetical protein
VSVNVSELVILQSLPGDEPQTGSLLKESLTTVHRLPIPVTLVNVATAESLLGLVNHMQASAERARGAGVPMLHLEVHGSPEGLGLASKEFLPWDTLAPCLRNLNVTVRNSIVLVLGVCSGAFAMTAAANSPFEPSPFYGLVGPDQPVPVEYLPDAFEAFYSNLLRSGDFVAAVNALRQYLPEYGGYDTATLFRLGWSKYVEACDGEQLTDRVERIVSRIPGAQIADPSDMANARAAIAQQIRETVSHRDEHYSHFIMTDIYPEIALRFPVTHAA